MSEHQRHEKEEKQEKEEEKRHQEDEKEEKNWDEKWRRDPLSAVVWAGILIWAGLVLLAENLGAFVRFEQLDAWALVFLGAGLMVLLEVAIRLLMPAYRRPVTGSILFGVILLVIGLGNLVRGMTGRDVTWAIVLIVIGVIMLLRSVGWRRE